MRLFTPSRSWCAALVCAAAVPLLTVPGSASAAPGAVVKRFNSPGEHEFIVPTGVTRIHLTAVGAGAGGGGGGGNNDGPLTGGGGGGGASGALESCTIDVKAGGKVVIGVGKGGAGGAGGSGQYNNGKPGEPGKPSYVITKLGALRVGQAGATHGRPGQGGEASGNWESGYGRDGGASGTGSFCAPRDHVRQPGHAGTRGQDGERALRGRGGAGGEAPVFEPGCSAAGADGNDRVIAGAGGRGGNGAGRNPENGTGTEDPSQSGEQGHDGCVVLTYTP